MTQPRTCLITGANTGIGEVTARELLRADWDVVLACRSRERAEAAAKRMAEATGRDAPPILDLDLGSLRSVRDAAHRFLDEGRPLHCLINNAGVAGFRGQTEDGFELAFGVNHLGHFLFTRLLTPRLVESAKDGPVARVVNVASRAHQRTRRFNLDRVKEPTRTVTGYPEYAVSKLANVLFSARLALELKDQRVHSFSLHPGVVASDVWRRVPAPIRALMKRFMITNEEGALTTLHCATADGLATGTYFSESAPKQTGRLARRVDYRDDLWARSEEWCSEFLDG
ncbi:MAG: SDR family NAD(P)-dependent oxidoreductase [Myxococcota bacterium]